MLHGYGLNLNRTYPIGTQGNGLNNKIVTKQIMEVLFKIISCVTTVKVSTLSTLNLYAILLIILSLTIFFVDREILKLESTASSIVLFYL